MLTEIRIAELGALCAATAEFDRGLTVLTGETGAGKTMVVTGLHLLGGARAEPGRVRSGAQRAVVEGRFHLDDSEASGAAQSAEILDSSGADRDDDGSVIAVRSISREGPSRSYLGGRSVPVKVLSSFTTGLLTVHGQNDQLRLMRSDQQRAAVDRYAATQQLRQRYRQVREQWQSARRELSERTTYARERVQEADQLEAALAEIEAVNPVAGEDNALVADIRRLSELDAIRDAAAGARVALVGSAEDAGDIAARGAGELAAEAVSFLDGTDDAVLAGVAAQIAQAVAVLGDSARELGGFLQGLPADTSALEAKLVRQAQLRGLTRKYAADCDGVLRWAAESRERLAQLDVSEEALTALSRQVDELEHGVAIAAVELSDARTVAAKDLAKAVTGELAGLAMADAEFTVTVNVMTARGDDDASLRLASGQVVYAGDDGIDQVEFGFTAHRGTDVLSLAKNASGGELSRVMLALEVVLAASVQGTTMVFDEVDAGVGGRAAVQIGRRLARLAQTHQVIVVTHLPQVAAYADTHLVVEGSGTGGSGAASVVRQLDDEQRVVELARMLAGLGDSDTGRAHARELLGAARGERSTS